MSKFVLESLVKNPKEKEMEFLSGILNELSMYAQESIIKLKYDITEDYGMLQVKIRHPLFANTDEEARNIINNPVLAPYLSYSFAPRYQRTGEGGTWRDTGNFFFKCTFEFNYVFEHIMINDLEQLIHEIKNLQLKNKPSQYKRRS